MCREARSVFFFPEYLLCSLKFLTIILKFSLEFLEKSLQWKLIFDVYTYLILKNARRMHETAGELYREKDEGIKMNFATISYYITEFGAIAIFIIVLLEYLNMPGFPAGVIMPLAGIMAANGKMSFLMVMLVTVTAGLIGSLTLYLLGFKGGEVFLRVYIKKFPKYQSVIEKNMEWIRQKGCTGVFVGKLLPMVRTLISIPAGVARMDLVKYTASSLGGIIIWNFVFVGAGYLLGEPVFQLLGIV